MAYGRNKITSQASSVVINSYTDNVPTSGTSEQINLFSFANSNSKSIGFWSSVHSKFFMLFSPGQTTTPPVLNQPGAIPGNFCFVDDPIVGWTLYCHNGLTWKYLYLYELGGNLEY